MKFRSLYYLPGILVQFAFNMVVFGQPTPFPFRDTTLTPEVRTQDLIQRLTPNEKLGQLLNASPAIPRLQIPEYNWWNECLHGVARSGEATVFPQPIGLAATWNDSLLYRIGDATSTEARFLHHQAVRNGYRGIYYGLTFWAPNINLLRDPRWGRGHETYGEDPLLSGKLAAAFVRGLQGTDPDRLKVVATPKHFAVHSGPENIRHGFNAVVSEKDLHESYLPQFRTAVVEGKAASVMCAYNRINGEAACASRSLLHSLLRNDWKFDGYVVSDCGAVEDLYMHNPLARNPEEAAALALKNGMDLECMVGVPPAIPELLEAVLSGRFPEAHLDTALARLIRAKIKLGLLDESAGSRWVGAEPESKTREQHRNLALQAALESAVLLKNEKEILPLSKNTRLVLLGPHVEAREVMWGNYHGVTRETVTPKAGIEAFLGRSVPSFKGAPLIQGFPDFEVVDAAHIRYKGKARTAKGSYFNRSEPTGKPDYVCEKENVNFFFSPDAPPKSQISAAEYAVRWEGEIQAPETGWYQLGGLTEGAFRLYVNGTLLAEEWPRKNNGLPVMGRLYMKKGISYPFRLEYQRHEYSFAKLVWQRPGLPESEWLRDALKAAAGAEVVVAFLGLSPNLEGEEMGLKLPGFENGDRTHLRLPESQRDLLRELRKLGKPIVTVLINGGVVADSVLVENSNALLEMWYPGQEGGRAVAKLLFGEQSPSGKLPATVYASVRDLPPFENYSMEGRTYKFLKTKPLFPFGFGLGYTSFSFSGFEVRATETGFSFRVRVRNSGKKDGQEVVQLYGRKPGEGSEGPLRLNAFRKVRLKAGEETWLQIETGREVLDWIGSDGKPVREKGTHTFFIGGGLPEGNLGSRSNGLSAEWRVE